MFRIINIIIFLIVLVVGVQFSAVNSEPVTVNYLLGTASLPLSFVVVSAFAAGVVVSFIVSLGIILPLRWRVTRLQRSVSVKDHEIKDLRHQTVRNAG